MAEESGGAGWWGAWGTEFLANVRNKSAEAMSMVKNDLSEFVCTIQHDTSTVVADTATAVKESLKVEEEEPEGTSARFKQGVSKFLGTLSTSLRENISHVATAAASVASDAPEPVFDRMQARLHEIQIDPATFCSEPDGHLGMYEDWCKTFDPEQHKGEISELLVNVPEIRALYAKLVPSAVTHVLFWQRYFYKVHQLEQEEKKRAALVARANQVQSDEELGWGDDDLWDTEEPGVESVTSEPADNEQHNVTAPGNGDLTGNKDKELVNNASDEVKTEQGETAKQPSATVREQDNTVSSTEMNKDQGTSEKLSEGEFVAKSKQHLSQEPTELVAERAEQTSDSQVENLNASNKDPEDVLPCEISKTVTDKVSEGDLRITSHKRDNSSGSVDSSWSKVSEEELKACSEREAVSKEISTGSGHSSSSSIGVLVPSVEDKDVDWDDDLDLNDDDMSGEEVKKIMQSMAANKQAANNQEDGDLDDDDWENWD